MKLNVDKTEGMLLGLNSTIPNLGNQLNNITRVKVKWCKKDKLLRSLGTQLTIAGNTDEFWEAKLIKSHLKKIKQLEISIPYTH